MPSIVLLIILCTIQHVAAQHVTSLFFPGIEPQALVGSVIDNRSSSTTYSIFCPSNIDTNECGVDGPMTAIEGPQTAIFNITDIEDNISAYINCNLSNSATATCTSTIDGSGAGKYTGISVTTLTDVSTMFLPVNITASATTSTATTIGTTTSSNVLATQTSATRNDGIQCLKLDVRFMACCVLTLLLLLTL